MRQKAEKLEKGKWYADVSRIEAKCPSFLMYSHSKNNDAFFSELKGHDLMGMYMVLFRFLKDLIGLSQLKKTVKNIT